MIRKILLLVFIFGFIVSCSNKEKRQVYTAKLKQMSFSSQSSTSGSFFLGCGSIGTDNNTYYFAYAKNVHTGAIWFMKVDTDCALIYEDGKNIVEYKVGDWNRYYGVKFHIPKNSIKQVYNVNLKR